VNCGSERVPCAGFADALNFAAGRTAGSEHRILVANNTAGFAAASINSEEEWHGKILTAKLAKKIR